jgi:hypothetical protein
MARKSSCRVQTNRTALSEAWLAVADGLLAVGEEIVAAARPPDAAPFGEGLVTRGAAGVWVDGKKIGGQAEKPRRVKVRQYPIVGIAGFGFPARFQEIGTVHQPSRPFLAPAKTEVVPRSPSTIRDAVQRRIGGLK